MAKKTIKKKKPTDSVQRKTNNPVVVDIQTIRIEQFGERKKNGQLYAFYKVFDDWPDRIYIVNREFRLKDIDRNDGKIESAYYMAF